MRVAMYYANDDIRIEDQPAPTAGPGEIVIRVEVSGICGSDVMQWYRAGKTPLVLGHEVSGEITELGAGVTAFSRGQRVVAAHHVPCNTCHYCLRGHHTVCDTLRATKFYPGGFAEYLRLPQINVDRGTFLIPDSMSYDEASFVEPLACVLRGQRAARVGLGDRVLVIGSGISGQLHIALAKALGAGFVAATDLKRYRLDMALQSGADAVIEATSDVPSEFRRLSGAPGADAVILTACSSAAIDQALASVDRGGTVLFFAPSAENATFPLPVNKLFWRNEITLTSSYAANAEEHLSAMEFIRTGRVDVKGMITHTLPLARTQEGFGLVAGGGNSMKVIVKPQL